MSIFEKNVFVIVSKVPPEMTKISQIVQMIYPLDHQIITDGC